MEYALKFAGRTILEKRKSTLENQVIDSETSSFSNFRGETDGKILLMGYGDWDPCETFKRCCADNPRNTYCCRRIVQYCE